MKARGQNLLTALIGTIIVSQATWAAAPAAPATPTSGESASTQSAKPAATSRSELIKAALQRDKGALVSVAVRMLDEEAIKRLDGPVGEKLKEFLALPIAAQAQDAYLEKPELISLNPGKHAGGAVYFVNGMATSREKAERDAAALSDQLRRPVLLLYNPTAIHGEADADFKTGIALDIAQAAYQRTWPYIKVQPLGIVQADPSTRQMAWILTHAEGPITVVSHSQGCLIVRNALLTAARMEEAETKTRIADRLTWIATGLPMRDEEIAPQPKGLKVIANPADPVAQSIGLRLDPAEFTRQRMVAHYFSGYLPLIGELKP